MTTKNAKAKTPKAPKKSQAEGRPVIYPEYKQVLHLASTGNALTVEEFSALMGFTYDEEEAKAKGCTEALFVDLDGKKVYSYNNVTNRPLYTSNWEKIKQELLNLNWNFNWEPVIIGRTGLVLNGQHQGVGMFMAEQERQRDPRWKKNWPTPITMDKSVCYGCSEEDRVVNTMDTCKARSLMDVICRSEFFRKVKAGERKTLSRMTENCVKLLWWRTARLENSFAPLRTHSEALEFLENHPHVVRAVRHVWEEYQSGEKASEAWKINNQRIGAGYAAALLFLMGCSLSDGDKYFKHVQSGTTNEKHLDWSRWDKACEFWTLFCSDDESLSVVRTALGQLADSVTGTGGSRAEREAVLVKAWNKFVMDEEIELEDVDLEDIYTVNDYGIRVLGSNPTVGGIDIADMNARKGDDDPSEDEIKAEAERIKKEKTAKKAKPKPKAKKKIEEEETEEEEGYDGDPSEE